MLREPEYTNVKDGLCLQFILKTNEEMSPIITLLNQTPGVIHIEPLENDQLMFICDTACCPNSNDAEYIFNLQEKIEALFHEEISYLLEYVSTRIEKDGYHRFGQSAHAGIQNLKISSQVLNLYIEDYISLSPKKRSLARAYYKIQKNVLLAGKKLRDIETQELKRGMYVRYIINFDEECDTKIVAEYVMTMENVKYAETINKQEVLFVQYIDDPFSHHHFPDKLKSAIYFKHDTLIIRNLYTLKRQLNHFLTDQIGVSYHVSFVTTNHGSFKTTCAGYIKLIGDEQTPDYELYTCVNEELAAPDGDIMNGVRGVKKIYNSVMSV